MISNNNSLQQYVCRYFLQNGRIIKVIKQLFKFCDILNNQGLAIRRAFLSASGLQPADNNLYLDHKNLIQYISKSTKLKNLGIVSNTRQPLLIITKFNTW